MVALTTTEKKVFNNLSQEQNTLVLLGDKIQELIDKVAVSGTPVNSAKASLLLTLTGVVKDGETVTVNNPLKTGTNVYEFLADTAQTKTAPGNIAINITSNTVKATINLTVDTQPTSGDTMTIGTKVYTFVPVGTDTADGEISIGADLAEAQVNIIAAINGSDAFNEPHPLVSAAAFNANVSAVTAFIGGTDGNAIDSTETFTAGTNIFSGAHLASGANCSAANACSKLITAVAASDTQDVGATAGEGTTVLFKADVGGTDGNDIVVGTTLANGTFDQNGTELVGGSNGTVGSGFMFDADYLYVCVASSNLASGANWRRISLGSAY